MKFLRSIIFSFIIMLVVSFEVFAVPDLQIYIPGATYDDITETWIINSYNYELWITGANQTIDDVRFAAAVPEDETGSIEITWLNNGVDGSGLPDYGILPSDQEYYTDGNFTLILSNELSVRTGVQFDYDDYLNNIYVPRNSSTSELEPDSTIYAYTESDIPVFGDGLTTIPPHGVFPADFYEYYIGDFSQQYFKGVYNYDPAEIDNNGNFTDIAPGMTKKFSIKVNGYTWVDLTAYDHYLGNSVMYVKTPFSHDGAMSTPEPATLFLFGSGLLSFGIFGRKKLFNKKKEITYEY